MKNAGNAIKQINKKLFSLANYKQIDNKIPQICELKGTKILSVENAWKKYDWTRKYFKKKPKYGYFIWVNKNLDLSLFTCASIASQNIKQDIQNLLVIESGIKVKIKGICDCLRKNLSGTHKASGKIIIKEDSMLEYHHIHSWGKKDIVNSDYEFLLEKNAKLDYVCKIFSCPEKLKIKTLAVLLENSSANLSISGSFSETQTDIKDTLILKQKNSSGIIKLKLAGRKNSKISACSRVIAKNQSTGHLDCQALLENKNSIISLIPELVCENNQAQITHEASIGRISEEVLYYLMTRGLNKKQAIDLIINGFLN